MLLEQTQQLRRDHMAALTRCFRAQVEMAMLKLAANSTSQDAKQRRLLRVTRAHENAAKWLDRMIASRSRYGEAIDIREYRELSGALLELRKAYEAAK